MSTENIENVYELTPLQEGMLFHTLCAPSEHFYFEQFSVPLLGTIDVVAFRRAWQYVVDRHAVLRSAFHWEGISKPLQVVFHRIDLPFETKDWRTLSPTIQVAQLEDYIATDLARGFKVDEAPLLRVSLIQLAADRYQFVLSFHHALLDGWSKALLTREVLRMLCGVPRWNDP